MFIAFYFAWIAAGYLLDKTSPSGPCTPGLGLFMLLLLPFVNLLLLVSSVIRSVVRKSFTPELLVHLLFLLFWVLVFAFGGE